MRPRTIGVLAAVMVVLALFPMAAARAQVDPAVTVQVTIERIRALNDDMDPNPFGTPADFYAVVNIDGTEFDNKNTPEQDANEDDDDISPNWQFTRSVPLSRGTVPLTIDIWDEDGFLRLDDDHVDVTSTSGRTLVMSVQLAPCTVSGGIAGSCGTTLTTSGTEGDRAELRFRIDVIEPASAPGLRVRCIHDPVWPDTTDTVTISLEALDGEHQPRVVDNVEIWVNDQSAPVVQQNGATGTSFTAGPFADPTFAYGCRIQDEGLTAWTGWRTVSVGANSDSTAPVLLTGPRSSRLDLVFIADRDDYTGPRDPAFLQDVRAVILNSYFAKDPNNPGTSFSGSDYDVFLANHDKYNFWVANNMGDAEDAASGCDHEAPSISWADSGVLLHRDDLRDCAPGGQRLFSSEPFSLGTVLHETGHRPFGLADEYCCDGGYFQNEPNPNLYEEPEDCAADAPSLLRTAGDCREYDEVIDWWFDRDWSISEPAGNDLMDDRGAPQAADLRRINWLFGNCQAAGC